MCDYIIKRMMTSVLQILIGNTSGSKTLLRIGTEGAGFAQPHPSRIGTIMLTINLHDAVSPFLMIC